MTRAFLRLAGLAFLGAALVPVVTVTCDRWSVHHAFSPGFLFELSGTALALAGTLGFYAVLRRYQSRVGQFGLLIGLRFGLAPWLSCLTILPFREQLNMGLPSARNLSQAIAIYVFLSVVFLLTVLAFVPIGQLCGRLMERREKLRSY